VCFKLVKKTKSATVKIEKNIQDCEVGDTIYSFDQLSAIVIRTGQTWLHHHHFVVLLRFELDVLFTHKVTMHTEKVIENYRVLVAGRVHWIE